MVDLLLITLVLFFFSFRSTFTFFQNDYVLDFERTDMEWYDPEWYAAGTTVKTFKYNRTTPAINVTVVLKKDTGFDNVILFEAFKFLSNEYRRFPMRFQMEFCSAIKNNEFGLQGMFTCGNLTQCPIKRGTYLLCNYTPDQSKFPPLIPNGRFKFTITTHFKSEPIMITSLYVEIKRPVKWQK